MRRSVLLVFAVIVLVPALWATDSRLQVNESTIRASIGEREIRLEVPVQNNGPRVLSGTITLELLDPNGTVQSRREQKAEFPLEAATTVTVVVGRPATKGRDGEVDPILWYRLRYRVTAAETTTEGIVALAAIAPDLFQLQLVHPDKAREGQPFHLRVHVANPITSKPVGGVRVSATLKLDEDDEAHSPKPVSFVRTTNDGGDALIVFQIPKTTATDADIEVTAEKSGVKRTNKVSVEFARRLEIITSTDKRLYQPGQALHVRALAFSNRKALNDTPLQFTLYDPDEAIVLRGTSRTNRFGIANVDWALPESLRLGDYTIKVHQAEDEDASDWYGSSLVRISRYELPNFSVNAKPDRPYYLPGENAEVEVAADYLFGKPVNHGSVRVVREDERRWNFEKQKWDIKEGEVYTGELDPRGRCKLKLDLTTEQKDFADREYYRFDDVNFAAYVTDTTTKRTEQRRFKLRLTHLPIHVYMIGGHSLGSMADFYVSTFYADGAPAQTRVEIKQLMPDPESPDGSHVEVPLRTVKTNRYGLAKVSRLPLRDTTEHYSRLAFTARDNKGLTGQTTDGVSVIPDYALILSSGKALYRAGEPLEFQIKSLLRRADIVVDLVRNGVPMRSQRVHLRHGRAFVVFPYELQFQGALTATAYSLEEYPTRWGEERAEGTLTVLYPHDIELKVKVNAARAGYRPGEHFSAGVRVSSPEGSGQASALGVVVVDKAVDERIRSDEEFGSARVGFWSNSWWSDPTSFGGISRADLDKVDTSSPVPADLDLVAEVILANTSGGENYRPEAEGYGYRSETRNLFQSRMAKQLAGVANALRDPGTSTWTFPTNEDQLANLLAACKVDLANLKDPWNVPYKFSFGLDYRDRTVDVSSAGPDKQFGTADDIDVETYRWEYFTPIGRLLARAIGDATDRQAALPREFAALRLLVLPYGTDLGKLRDPWGGAYEFELNLRGRFYDVQVKSAGPERHKTANPTYMQIWSASIDYLSRLHGRLDAALSAYTRQTGRFPVDEAEFAAAMDRAGIPFSTFRDPWGAPYYLTFDRRPAYGDKLVVQSSAGQETQKVVPVTTMFDWVFIHTAGNDGKRGTEDDAVVASFATPVTVQSANDAKPKPAPPTAIAGGTGAIRGTITDASGAVIPGATVTAKREGDPHEHTATTDSDGTFLIRGLESGVYSLRVSAPGFASAFLRNVPVQAQSVTVVSTTLTVGMVSTTVEVSAAPVEINTMTSAAVSSRPVLPGMEPPKPMFTPRLRQFFPETLFWAPSIITSPGGQARLNFKLADNITTWKMAVVASDENGNIGTAETEIGAFQPFFVEHEPPRVLTMGDEIGLPVVVRNYLDRNQQVNVQLHPAPWLSLLGAEKQSVRVATGESSRVVFPFRATAMVRDAAQRVTAANRTTGDAVEKPVTVHPDGRESSAVVTRVVGQNSTLNLDLPRDMVPGSMIAELKLYPNPLAHAIESIEAGLHRPYGCGEQTISSTYPSLLVLEYYKEHGVSDAGVARRAEKYLRLGYERLLNYRDRDSGGFTYWGRGEPDVALTAYAVRFLEDAQPFTDVDDKLISETLDWLANQQNADGYWMSRGKPDTALTAYVAEVLARILQPDTKAKKALESALKWLERDSAGSPDPYPVATFALAAARSGKTAQAASAIARLCSMVHHESDRVYWSLETNTPFYGWGRAGRVETTALALLALHVANRAEDKDLIDAGLLFLLENKDEYGVWYSGQTTVKVLDALLALMPPSDVSATTAEIVAEGKPPLKLDIPAAVRATGPVRVDISQLLSLGSNSIQLRIATPMRASVQLVATYYVPWTAGSDVREQVQTGESRGLRLAVRYDKPRGQLGDEVRCSVSAERFGYRGWGMMLAEVGLPPGAEVDRASLEKAQHQGVERYDILPDRVVLYLWSQAGGTKFDFQFRPRMTIKARTAPSVLYDYYNPEEQVVVPPEDFKIRED